MTDSDALHADDEFDKHLFLNRESYERDFLPAYRQFGIDPKRLLQIPLILPFHVPFRNGMCLTFELASGTACTLTFGVVSSVQHVHAGIVSDKSIAVPHHRSRVELVYVSGDDADVATNEETLSKIFDELLRKLNAVIVAYITLTKDYRAYRLSREMFEFGSVYRLIAPGEWEKSATGLFLLHRDVPFEKPEMSSELHEHVVWYTHVIEQQLNPFILVEELSVSARRELLGGGYRESVVFAQTAVETMLATILSHAMNVEGRPDAEIEQQLQDVGFATRLKREYHTRFGGVWSVEKHGTPVADWFTKTYRVRNRIVHAGYAPTYFEASAALEAASDMISFVVARCAGVQQAISVAAAVLRATNLAERYLTWRFS
jgi:hypothetical protein